MRTALHRAVILVMVMLTAAASFAQDFSNKGKDFWIGYGNHVRMFTGNGTSTAYEKMQLYITSDVNTTAQVTIPSVGFSQSVSITANQISTVDIPRTAALLDQGLYDHGIHVTAQNPVVVYSFIYVNAISGATVCLPTETLGKNYFSVNYTQNSNDPNSYSYFFVVAADTGTTTVEITPSGDTKAGQPAGVPFTVDLKQGQIYQVLGKLTSSLSGVDLTGSKIRSISTTASGCKKIAVYCGSGKIKIGSNCANANTSDNLYQQMYPTQTWGKKYITVPAIVNTTNTTVVNTTNYFRVCKSDPTANVMVNGNLIPASSFVNGFYYEFSSSAINVVESDKPILVAQYFTTQNCDGNPSPGDPEMIYLNPVEQTIDKVTLNSMQPATGTNITRHYLNVVLKNNPAAINSFKIDGTNFTSFTPVPGDPSFAYARVATTAGTHYINCDTGFNVIAYGFGNAESYGYSGGTNLKDLYQFVSIKNQYAAVDFPATCKDAPFFFSMVFPYQPTQIKWLFNGLFTDTTVFSPAYDSTWMVNGKQLYRYKLANPYVTQSLGNFPIRLIAQNPTPDGCSGEQQIDFILQVFEKPRASFTTLFKGCLGDTTSFKDNSVLDRPTIRWMWNFDDGDTAQSKNPVHLFNKAGSYNVKFNLITDIGCFSDTATSVVEVNSLPAAQFTFSNPDCVNKNITFTDASTIPSGKIATWNWQMGNGDSSVKATNTPFTYAYKSVGKNAVSLQAISDKGCVSKIVTQTVTVSSNPLAGFISPANCIADPFSQFTDSSKIADGTESQFAYLWNFGDGNASTANPNTSTLKNPKHKFSATGSYNVSLLVTSNAGCVDSVKNVFTVNGAKPQSAFTLSGGSELCSNKDLVLTNNSSADFGSIVRLEVYWDYSNDPTNKTIDPSPKPGKTYTHTYPEFFTPASKNNSVYVVAYSGDNCLNSASQMLMVKATPQLQFDSLPSVCGDAAPFALTQAKVQNGLSGKGIYSGSGVIADSIFHPGKAAIGIDTIRYNFTATNGCSNSTKNAIQVFAVPTADAGPDRFVLEGGSETLLGHGSGVAITYAWTPALYLNKADIDQPKTSPPTDMNYTLTVTSGQGCKASDLVAVTILKSLLVPNAFSPNGDGIHDRWEIPYLNTYPGATVNIFNRYGQLIYKSDGYSKPWDGTFNGSPAPVGTYYYIINPKNGRQQMSGFIDLIR